MGTVLGVHPVVLVVHHRCQGHADRLLFVPEHRTQPPLTPPPIVVVVVVVVVVEVVEVVVRTYVLHEGVCPATRTLAPNSGGRTPGSKLPASPPPVEPSTTKNSSSSRARKLTPWRSTPEKWRSAKNAAFHGKNLIPDVIRAAC